MPAPRIYRLRSLVLLPFRDHVAEGHTEFMFGPEPEPTLAAWYYGEDFRVTGSVVNIPTRHCTYVEIDFPQRHQAAEDEFREWVAYKGVELVSEAVLPRINHLLAAIQLSEEVHVGVRTNMLRNVGEIDLLFHNISLDGDPLFTRVSPPFLAAGLIAVPPVPLPPHLDTELSAEWLLLTRAVHLVNHGFLAEAVSLPSHSST
jgi:hypothetical protein